MVNPRLSLALESADPLPPEGRVLVLGPRTGADLTVLPKDRTLVVQGFFPDHQAFVRLGYHVLPDLDGAGEGFAAAIVFMPRSRAEARNLVAEAARRVQPGRTIWVDGQKTDGIDAMIREVRSRAPVSAPIAKAHGKIFGFTAGPDMADWIARPAQPVAGFKTVAGVFSSDGPDRASRLLAAALPAKMSGIVADLGAGWGYLSRAILERDGVRELHVVEADHAALTCAKENVTDPRARFHWADATAFSPPDRPAFVVMNPPFHQTRAADPRLGEAFITAAAGMLVPSGTLFMVANRHLPYESVLSASFREVEEIGGDSGFKIIRAARPGRTGSAPSRPRR